MNLPSSLVLLIAIRVHWAQRIF